MGLSFRVHALVLVIFVCVCVSGLCFQVYANRCVLTNLCVSLCVSGDCSDGMRFLAFFAGVFAGLWLRGEFLFPVLCWRVCVSGFVNAEAVFPVIAGMCFSFLCFFVGFALKRLFAVNKKYKWGGDQWKKRGGILNMASIDHTETDWPYFAYKCRFVTEIKRGVIRNRSLRQKKKPNTRFGK